VSGFYKHFIPADDMEKPKHFADDVLELRRAAHKTAAGVAKDIEDFAMNKAVARIRELSNTILHPQQAEAFVKLDGGAWATKEALEILIKVFNPMMPHLAEELWNALGHDTLLADESWPEVDESLLVDDTVTVGVQVNGKRRAEITLPADATEDIAREVALSEHNVEKFIEGKEIRKFIYVPGKIVNVVAA